MNLGLFFSHPFVELAGVALTPLTLTTFVLSVLGLVLVSVLTRRLLRRFLDNAHFLEEHERRSVAAIVSNLILWFGLLASIETLGFAIGKPLLTLAGTGISLYSLAASLALGWVVLTGSSIASRWVASRLLARMGLEEGLRYAVGRIIYYVLIVLGMMAVLQTLGVQLGSLTVLVGALGVGIGFGLQNIVNNFVSGLILLFERPIKVGDWIETGKVAGRVTEIGARSTKVVTADNVTLIIPNGDCLSQHLTNWSYNGSLVRFRIPVRVAFDSDLELVTRLLVEAGAEHAKVLQHPPPKVLFQKFGEFSYDLELAVWIRVGTINRRQLFSDLNFAIERKFRDKVTIPYPLVGLRPQTEEDLAAVAEPARP